MTQTTARPVVLFGASGRTGLAMLERAAPAGLRVRAVVRDPARIGRFAEHPNVEVVRASFDDSQSLDAAIASSSAVVSALGPRGLDPASLCTNAFRAIVTSMARVGARRLLAVTSSGHEPDKNFPLFFKAFVKPVILRRIYEDMAAAEKVVESSDLDWTIVRPSMFVGHLAAKSYRVADRLNPSGGWKISREHTAEFMLDELAQAKWIRRHPALAY
jgi:putative NADH-flavin reductase